MKTTLRCLLFALVLMFVGAPTRSVAAAAAAPADASYEVVQIWACDMTEGTTEEQVEAIAADWLKALRTMPGGAAIRISVFFPTVVNKMGDTDFYFVINVPSYADWGKLWDAYSDDSAAAKSEDLNQGKVACPDSMLWEAHAIK